MSSYQLLSQFPITAIREIKLLRDMEHENVVKLKEVVSSKVDWSMMRFA